MVKFLSGEQASGEFLRLLRTCSSVSLAVAWSTKGEVADAILASGKLKRAVVGTHMYITSPDVLRQFGKHRDARVVPPDHPRLFHPKVYVFEKGDTAWAIVGSHNLTRRAFGLPHMANVPPNVEASVLIEGTRGTGLIKELHAFIDASWSAGERLDEQFLFPYTAQFEANRQHLKALKTFHRVKRPKKKQEVSSPLHMSWAEFAKQTREQDQHDFQQRLVLLDAAQRIFGTNRHFDAMSLQERKAIAGTFGPIEEQLGDVTWGWFGTMFSQGDFKYLVNRTPAGLSKALDHIPPLGEVKESHFRAFVEDFRSAFQGRSRTGSYPTASRLLAMKRPDQFVAVNSKNRQGLCGALGEAYSTLTLDNYWERIVVPIRLCPWWLAERPKRKVDASLWDNRAAMLDCLYYVKTEGDDEE